MANVGLNKGGHTATMDSVPLRSALLEVAVHSVARPPTELLDLVLRDTIVGSPLRAVGTEAVSRKAVSRKAQTTEVGKKSPLKVRLVPRTAVVEPEQGFPGSNARTHQQVEVYESARRVARRGKYNLPML